MKLFFEHYIGILGKLGTSDVSGILGPWENELFQFTHEHYDGFFLDFILLLRDY